MMSSQKPHSNSSTASHPQSSISQSFSSHSSSHTPSSHSYSLSNSSSHSSLTYSPAPPTRPWEPPTDYPFCHDVAVKYEKLTKIGQGTFGEVFKARNKETRALVALKKVLMENEKEGFPITALREIKILQLLKHENVVNLQEICRSNSKGMSRFKSTFYLVFDLCDHDLAGLLCNVNIKFSLGEIKKVMQQLLNGLYYIHSNKILHRDMKAANILITRSGLLKLADFGLARAFSQNIKKSQPNRYTNRVVTLWYRPPELLLGERNYGPAIDLWGAGCIMAEMWVRSPIMQGSSEQNQLTLITQLCGSITPETWPGCDLLDLYPKIDLPKDSKRKVKERLAPYMKDQYALDLQDKLLTLDPSKRIDSDNALNHDFFWTDPMPQDLAPMLSKLKDSMFEFLAPPRRPGNPTAAQMAHQQATGSATGQASRTARGGHHPPAFRGHTSNLAATHQKPGTGPTRSHTQDTSSQHFERTY